MSILKRPGWANYEVVNEGRLHNDKLKDRIGKMFDRLSLGYSPNHVIDKIANTIRSEKGDKFDYNKLSNEYIIDIAKSDSLTRGKFTPSLKPSFASQYQNTNSSPETQIPSSEPVSMEFSAPASSDVSVSSDVSIESPSVPVGVVPSEDAEESNMDEESSEDAEETESSEETEDAEEVKTCTCQKHDSVSNPEIAKKSFEKANNPKPLTMKTAETHRESIKLSPKAVNQLLKENYIKQKQHLSRIEERYGRI